jgi:hypothetical protein
MRLELESRQNQLLDVIAEFERILVAPIAIDLAELGELRIAAERMMADHYRFKELLFARLRECGSVPVDRQVAQSRSAMLALQVAHRFHLTDWPADAIAHDWAGFVVAAQAMTARIRAVVMNDREHLYSILGQVFGVEPASTGADPATQAVARALGRVGHTSVAA